MQPRNELEQVLLDTIPLSEKNAEHRVRAAGRPLWRRRVKIAFVVMYVCLLCLISFSQAVGPERFWWSGLNLYLPQWLWGLPGSALLSIAVHRVALRKDRWTRDIGACLAV